jgi:hypothetical protein
MSFVVVVVAFVVAVVAFVVPVCFGLIVRDTQKENNHVR